MTDYCDDNLRFAAVRALGAMGPAAAEFSLHQVVRALDDPDELVREAAAEALVAMNCPDALKGAMAVGDGRAILAAALPGKAAQFIEPIKPTPVEIYFENADYKKVDHDAFKKSIFEALGQLGLQAPVADLLTISLYEGSIVAQIDGPVEALDSVRALSFEDGKLTFRIGLKRYEGQVR